MKQLFGFLGLVLIWPGGFLLLGFVSHIFLGEEFYSYPFGAGELVVPIVLLGAGCALRQGAKSDGFERTAHAIATLAKIGTGLSFVFAAFSSFSSGFEGQGHWIMTVVYLATWLAASWARTFALLQMPGREPAAIDTSVKTSALSKEFLKERWCTWDGAKFVNAEGNVVPSRAHRGEQLLNFLREQTDSDQPQSRIQEANLYASDHWHDLDALEPGDEIWLYTRRPLSGRALVRDGRIIAYTEDSHLNHNQLIAQRAMKAVSGNQEVTP